MYSILLAVLSAVSIPMVSLINPKIMSMPADTPEEVKNFPSQISSNKPPGKNMVFSMRLHRNSSASDQFIKKGMFEEIVLIQFWSGGAGESH